MVSRKRREKDASKNSKHFPLLDIKVLIYYPKINMIITIVFLLTLFVLEVLLAKSIIAFLKTKPIIRQTILDFVTIDAVSVQILGLNLFVLIHLVWLLQSHPINGSIALSLSWTFQFLIQVRIKIIIIINENSQISILWGFLLTVFLISKIILFYWLIWKTWISILLTK